MKEGAKFSSGVPPVIGKHTYYRKKLSRKELCSSRSEAVDDSSSGKQPVTKFRKHASGGLGETAGVKITTTKRGKTKMIKGKKDIFAQGRSSPVNVNSSLHSDQSSLKKKTSRKVLEISCNIQSIYNFLC